MTTLNPCYICFHRAVITYWRPVPYPYCIEYYVPVWNTKFASILCRDCLSLFVTLINIITLVVKWFQHKKTPIRSLYGYCSSPEIRCWYILNESTISTHDVINHISVGECHYQLDATVDIGWMIFFISSRVKNIYIIWLYVWTNDTLSKHAFKFMFLLLLLLLCYFTVASTVYRYRFEDCYILSITW